MADRTSLQDALAIVEAAIDDPREGLPLEVFQFMTRITPSVNVDLLIRDPDGRTLLAWRSDEWAGTGWHIPGGILRYKETLETRLAEVVRIEIGRPLRIREAPIAITQISKKHQTRGHFVSVLYECLSDEKFEPDNGEKRRSDAGFLAWHETCPSNLIESHDVVYRQYIETQSFEDFSGAIPHFYLSDL